MDVSLMNHKAVRRTLSRLIPFMGVPSMRGASEQQTLSQSSVSKRLKWALVGVASLSVLCVGWLPAIAVELSAWRYDSRSRSLTLTLHGTTIPSVSVTAPDQLLVELPDTQVGDVRAQRVQDGFVERIALEQATPETVWVVVDFVPGTVLSDTQQATPLAASSNAIQLWKVEPTLMASRRVADAAITTQTDSNAGAAALATPSASPSRSNAIAQADFPDLPVLEPATLPNQTVIVPPIGAAPTTPVRSPETSAPVVDIPVIEADAIESAPPFLESTPAPAQPAPIETVELETASSREEIADSRFESRSAPFEPPIEPPAERRIEPNESRWPAPIPFGQPLP